MKRAIFRDGFAALLVTAILLPLAVLALMSLSREWRYPELWPASVQLRQWQVFSAEWQPLFATTVRSASLALAVGIVASTAGFMTSRRIKLRAGYTRWLSLAILPFAVSPVVLGLSLGQSFTWLGLSGKYAGVALAQFPFAYAYAVLLTQGFWNRHTHALSELALALGASEGAIWWRVRLPLARGLLVICLFQTALMSWFDFALARLIGAGRVETLPLKVFDYFGAGDLRLAAAAGVLLVAPPAVALLLNPRLLVPSIYRLPR